MEIEIQPRLPAFNATQHKVFDGIKTDRAHLQRILDGGMQHILFIVFQQAENLHVKTKIVALVDVLGNLIRFLLLPGQVHEMKGVAPLSKGVSFDALFADKAFDADWPLQDLDERGATVVIPPKTNRKLQRNCDAKVYKWRHLVENDFAKIKELRGIATRCDRTDCSYAACWILVAALIASR